MTNGEIAALVTVIGSVFSLLGITGIDSSVISSALSGIIAFVTIGTAVYAYFQHKKAATLAGLN